MPYLSPRATKKKARVITQRLKEMIYTKDAFRRDNEADDSEFYAVDRFVSHLDETARESVRRVLDSLIVEEQPVMLDLMASWDSHLPPELTPARVVGLGLNPNELSRNPRLDEFIVQDLNRDPRLSFPDASFDVVLNVASVEYLTQPFKLFREVGRILKPGGLFAVIFSDRMFPEKAIDLWRESSEQERIMMVEDFFADARVFESPRLWVSKGLPRPADDRYAGLSEYSDPVYVVAAVREGGPVRERPFPQAPVTELFTPEEVRVRRETVGETLRCPHCDAPLARWEVPQTPYTAIEAEFVYICPNNRCPYLVRGWQAMGAQGMPGSSYRLMYDPERGRCQPVPITGLKDLQAP